MSENVENSLPAESEKHGEPDPRLAEMEKAVSAANERLDQLNGSLKQAVDSYRALVIRANPDVLPELISGESIEALDGSLSRARELIGKVKSGLETQAAAMRVPSGAPQRGTADITGLSAREKINLGIDRARGR
jgi:hypothetical protein